MPSSGPKTRSLLLLLFLLILLLRFLRFLSLLRLLLLTPYTRGFLMSVTSAAFLILLRSPIGALTTDMKQHETQLDAINYHEPAAQ